MVTKSFEENSKSALVALFERIDRIAELDPNPLFKPESYAQIRLDALKSINVVSTFFGISIDDFVKKISVDSADPKQVFGLVSQYNTCVKKISDLFEQNKITEDQLQTLKRDYNLLGPNQLESNAFGFRNINNGDKTGILIV